MEPTLPAPANVPRNGEVWRVPQPIEATPSSAERSVEVPAPAEREATTPADPAVPPMVAPAIATVPVVPTAPVPQPGAGPAVAADDDVIEKEWVDRIKQVVAETRHDPHLQGQEVGKLQADYLQKRFGKTIKLPEE